MVIFNLLLSVQVDRTQTPQDLILSTGRKLCGVESDVVDAMPKGESVEGRVRVYLFRPDACAYNEAGVITDEDLTKEYEKHGLIPIDPYSLGTMNKLYPGFARKFPHGTHWRDSLGNWCHHAFVCFEGEDRVHANRSVRGWKKFWAFAGLSK